MDRPKRIFNRNFIIQWQGQSVSRLGDQVFAVAMMLWIVQATGSATLMGLLQMLSTLPSLLLGPFGGTLADRYSRWKIIIISDVLRGLAVLVLAGLTFFAPAYTYAILGSLFVSSLIIAVVGAFFSPAIQATIPDLVPEKEMTRANSLGQLSFQISLFIGQGLGGVLFRLLGGPAIFLFNGLSYLYSGASEVFVAIPQKIPETKGDWRAQFRDFRGDLVQGLAYIWRRNGLRETVLLSAVQNFFSTPILVLMPFFVLDSLKAATDWYGYIMVAFGAGSLLGYVLAGAANFTGIGRGRLMMVFILFHSAIFSLMGLTTNTWFVLVLALFSGIAEGFVTVNITTVLQITTPSEMRGRVFGLLGTIAGSLVPVAMGLSGIAADLVNKNIPLIYISCSIIMTVVFAVMALNHSFRSFLAYESPLPEATTVREEAAATD